MTRPQQFVFYKRNALYETYEKETQHETTQLSSISYCWLLCLCWASHTASSYIVNLIRSMEGGSKLRTSARHIKAETKHPLWLSQVCSTHQTNFGLCVMCVSEYSSIHWKVNKSLLLCICTYLPWLVIQSNKISEVFLVADKILRSIFLKF